MKDPVTHDQMIRMFDSNQKANMEIINAMRTAVNATTRAETHRIDVKLNTVITKQDNQNNAVANNIKEIASNSKTTDKINRFTKNTKWYLFGLFGFCYSVAWIHEHFDLMELIILIFNKV